MTIRYLSIFLVAISLLGCGEKGKTVSGTVKFLGKPVVFGTVVMIGSDGTPKSGAIQSDGTFKIENVIGKSPKVSVSSPPPPGVKVAPSADIRSATDTGKTPQNEETVNPEVVKNWFPIPSQYSDPNTSGITIEIQGDMVSIDLKDLPQERVSFPQK